jgi:hypothetical protein
MRKAAVAVTAVVLLLAGAAFLLPRLVSLDAWRPRLVSALEEKTGRKVSVGPLSLSLFPAVAVRVGGLSVSGDAGREAEPLLSVAEGEVRLSLRPLLSGRVVLSKVLLTRPSILFRRYPDGTHSLTEAARRFSAPEGSAEGAKDGKGSFSLAIRSLVVTEASLSVRTVKEGGGEERFDLAPVNLSLSGLGEGKGEYEGDVTLSRPVRGKVAVEGTFLSGAAGDGTAGATVLRGRGTAFDQPFTFEGRREAADGKPPVQELSLAVPELRVEALPALFPAPPPALAALRPEGKGSLSVHVSGTPDALGFEAEGDLTDAAWTVRPGLRKGRGEPCTFVVQGRRFPDRIVLVNGELRVPPLLAVANGSLSPASGGHEWALHARLDDLAALARHRGGALSPYAPEGRVTLQGSGRRLGREGREEYTVDADLAAVAFRLPDRPLELRDVAGHVTLLPDSIHFQPLGGLVNGQRFHAAGIVGLKGGARGDLELRMARLDLDALLSALRPQGKGEGAGKAKEGDGKGASWSVSARVAVDSGKAKGIEFTSFAGTVRASPGRYEFDDAGMKAFGGSVSATGWARTSGSDPAFRAKLAMRDVSAEKLLAWKTSLAGYVEGRTGLDAELSGSLGGDAALARTLAGKGRLTLAGAKVRGFNLVGAATGAVGLPPLPGLPAPSVPETALSDMAMDFTVSDGRVSTENLAFRSGKSSFRGSGSIGLDKTLDLSGLLRLPPETVGKSAGKFLLTAGGFLDLPVKIRGPLASPSISVDVAEVVVGTVPRVVRGIVEAIPGMGPGKEGAGAEGDKAPPPPAGGTEGETGKLIRGLFDRILPKR